jgi:hypothetical protein
VPACGAGAGAAGAWGRRRSSTCHQQAEKRKLYFSQLLVLLLLYQPFNHLTPSYRDTFVPFPSLPFLSLPFAPSPSLTLRGPFFSTLVRIAGSWSCAVCSSSALLCSALLCAASHCCLRFQPSPSPRESVRIHACDIELFDQSSSFSQVPGWRPVLPALSRLCWTPLHCIERQTRTNKACLRISSFQPELSLSGTLTTANTQGSRRSQSIQLDFAHFRRLEFIHFRQVRR